MPYPHVIQFETLDRRRRRALCTADLPNHAAVARTHARRVLMRVARLRRTPRAASATI